MMVSQRSPTASRALVYATLAGGLTCLMSWSSQAQPKNCISQYADAPGTHPAGLIAAGYDIKSGWAGGLWLQKALDVYFCNSGTAREGDIICWKLRAPEPGHPCTS
jgi:hypothetical protein